MDFYELGTLSIYLKGIFFFCMELLRLCIIFSFGSYEKTSATITQFTCAEASTEHLDIFKF
jgi:hypothetical protein